MSFLELKNITKTYGGSAKACVKGLDLNVERNEVMVILGASGCGKTTTLKMIAGLEPPTEGEIFVDGERIDNVPPNKRPISMVFQKPLLFRNMTVRKNIGFGQRIRGMSNEEMNSKIDELIDLMGLEGLGERYSSQLSGGQEQRVSLARAIMVGPKIVLLDEPMSALDAVLRTEMREKILEIKEKLGLTVLLVTHDQQEAVIMADRIALMMNGRIIQCGIPDDFYTKPVNKNVAEFFGWKNFIPSVQNGAVAENVIGSFEVNGVEERTGDSLLLIRPEAISFSDNGEFTGTVKKGTYVGVRFEYVIECNGVELNLAARSKDMYYVGDSVKFDLDRSMMWITECESEYIVEEEIAEPKAKFFDKFKKKENKQTE